MSVQPFAPPGVLTANALAGQTVPGALGVSGVLSAGPLAAPLLELQATTGAAGFALQNATPAIITWTAPNDGLLHRVIVPAALFVSVTEVGGLIQVVWTGPGGSTASNSQLFAAALAAQTNDYGAALQLIVAANTAVTVKQNSALTGGAATIFAEIWGS